MGGHHPNYPVSRYGPVCVALADVRNAPRPAIDPNSRSYIGNYIQRHLTAGNGVVMYYCLRSRNELNNGIPEWEIAPWPSDYYKSDVVNPEIYLSVISGILHNQPVVYRGQDYPRRFQFQ